jgi:hypothetical protein
MKLITYLQNNGIGVIIPSDPSLTIEEIAERDVPQGFPFLITEELDVHDIYDGYLSAYDYNEETGAKVNIEKAKSIHLDKFRAARTPLLAKLDIDYMKAIEVEDSVKASQIAIAKQELRDVTKIELPDTLPEIKSTWPDILNA